MFSKDCFWHKEFCSSGITQAFSNIFARSCLSLWIEGSKLDILYARFQFQFTKQDMPDFVSTREVLPTQIVVLVYLNDIAIMKS